MCVLASISVRLIRVHAACLSRQGGGCHITHMQINIWHIVKGKDGSVDWPCCLNPRQSCHGHVAQRAELGEGGGGHRHTVVWGVSGEPLFEQSVSFLLWSDSNRYNKMPDSYRVRHKWPPRHQTQHLIDPVWLCLLLCGRVRGPVMLSVSVSSSSSTHELFQTFHLSKIQPSQIQLLQNCCSHHLGQWCRSLHKPSSSPSTKLPAEKLPVIICCPPPPPKKPLQGD